MKLLLAATLCVLAGCAGNPVANAHRSTVRLEMDNGTCSGTVVGPHTILTAEHCLTDTHTLAIDGQPVAMVRVTLDHHDHALVRVNATFSAWVNRGATEGQGQAVFVLGNPGDLKDMYRHGFIAGQSRVKGVTVTLYDLNGYYGDSGSGIFNDQGDLIGVVSVLEQQVDGGYMKLMGSFALAFTAGQWKAAGV